MKVALVWTNLTIILVIILYLSRTSNGDHDHIRHIFGMSNHQKLEFAKKIAAVLFTTYRAKKFLLPLPLPIPIPIPVFETYQPVMADPLFFKWLTMKEHFGGGGGLHHLGVHGGGGGLGGLGGIGGLG